ncbi:MAG TPA: lactate racemase domain-containing protein [Blastocatellia bacterium]|nr:lactate racemase domain-containing protein [Blastocatellia bacterium]
MRETIVFGDETIPVELPDHTVVIPASFSLGLPPVASLEHTVRNALTEPLELPPIRDIARPGHKVTIAFDDATVSCFAPVWEVAITQVLEELDRAGVARRDVTLVCANALHRKFTRMELARLIGEGLVKEFGYRLICHDAEDHENLVHLGLTASGYDVEVNRLVVESDLTVYVNTNCYRGFNGGWKSVCVGLSSYRSIRWHHNPDDMSTSLMRNPMHDMLNEMGEHLESKLGRRVFKIETVLADPEHVARIWAGSVQATRRAALELLKSSSPPRRDALTEKADIILYGIPNWSPYAAFSSMNPILTLISTGLGYLGGMIDAVGKPGCSVILATPCPNQWNDVHHSSYREVWQRWLSRTNDPYVIRDSAEDDFANRAEYIYNYRHCNSFHPVHALMATYPLKRLKQIGRVIVAGAEEPSLAHHLGFETSTTVEDAIALAKLSHGSDGRVAYVKYPAMTSRR